MPHQPNLEHIGQTLNARGCAYATCPAAHASISVTIDLYSNWVPSIEDQTAAATEDALTEDSKVSGEGSEIGAS